MQLDRSGYDVDFLDTFAGEKLDLSRWIPAYLPQRSNRARSAARYELRGGRLRLLIEQDQEPWSPEHNGGLRVSNLQTGAFSGPIGSTIGQHHFTHGLRVKEAQPEQRLYTPFCGIVEARVAAIADPTCMVALWLIGFEDEPHRSAEICVFEIFGSEIEQASALVGLGLHPFGDTTIRDDFVKSPAAIDATKFHTYSVECCQANSVFSSMTNSSRQRTRHPSTRCNSCSTSTNSSRRPRATTPKRSRSTGFAGSADAEDPLHT